MLGLCLKLDAFLSLFFSFFLSFVPSFFLFTQNFRLDSLNYEAELIAQCLVSVGHADLGHVGPADVVPLWSVFQVVHPDKVLLILWTNSKLHHYG